MLASLKFSVDADLLRELGERLIGKHYIALAELVKNSYDADATKVTINIDPENDRIEVRDNGHGMDFTEFQQFWMRIGSTHKEKQKISRRFGRPLTGSKGVGRLSVQFLAKKLELRTISDKNLKKALEASVEWEKAIQARELIEAEVEYDIIDIKNEKEPESQGTTIILSGLKHDWKDAKSIRGLAQEIWWLQPPFRNPVDSSVDREKAFEINFESSATELMKEFDWQLRAVMDSWHAKLVGRNSDGKVNFALEFSGQNPVYKEYTIPDCKLKDGHFEIRIFHFKLQKPRGIRVKEAYEYLDEYGGVHVYDGGFHLPYYGMKKNDWLGIEHDHAMRTRQTDLLPKELRFEGGVLSFLPNLSRIFGVVNVDTSKEEKEEGLKILITRDRLQDNKAYNNLVYMIRWAMDFYANEEAKRSSEVNFSDSEIEPPREKFERIEDVLTKYKDQIPVPVYTAIYTGVQSVTDLLESEAEARVRQTSLLGPLATAGISSLAFQHELKQQFRAIDDIVSRIDNIAIKDKESQDALNHLKVDLISWVKRAQATNSLFTYLADAENIGLKQRFKAKKIVEEIKDQVDILRRDIPIDTNRIDGTLRLPKATLAEWSSIFQNVFINAFNAMVDSKKRNIDVSSRVKEGYQEILVQDTGSGVNLADAEELFKPFVRRAGISPERRALGYGGTGLGLTIVDMVAKNIGCKVSFVKPELGYKTAFSIKWKEQK
jgi:signal transduction histidine kinase